MLIDQVAPRLSTVDLLPMLRDTHLQMLADDGLAMSHTTFPSLIPTIYRLLGGSHECLITPFAGAWITLIAASRRLDHAQDDEQDEQTDPSMCHVGAKYNVLLSYMLVALSVLDDLDTHAIPAARILRLRRLWSNSLLRAASGQQEDLEASYCQGSIRTGSALDWYQQIAQAKSGALFGLAFGGTAILATDEQAIISALTTTGEAFGTLLQYSDDLRDVATQPLHKATLPFTYAAAIDDVKQPIPPHDVFDFWHRIYCAHLRYVDGVLAPCTSTTKQGIRQLFAETFEKPVSHEMRGHDQHFPHHGR